MENNGINENKYVNDANKLTKIVTDLYFKYQDNPIIFNKMTQYIENLPELLETANNTIIERAERKTKLECESETFIHKFLHNHKFYYHGSSDIFFEYKDNKYILIREDDVQHTILSTISANKTLMDWKHRLKVTILKKIKDRDIFSCIPESETIQSVINRLCPSICDSREKAKYFLTVLGDILMKRSQLVYFLHPKTKPFLKELSNLSCMLFGTPNLLNIFKFKYYDHNFTECRLVDIQEATNLDTWTTYIKQENALDLFCVAAHYSTRYEGAENFLQEHCKDEELKTYALYLKNNNEKQIINHFFDKNIEHSDDCSISWKNMQYLWKQFIETEKLPNVFFTTTLKLRLIDKFKYDGHKDVFLDCTSKLLPTVSKFIQFWNDNIESNMGEKIDTNDVESIDNSNDNTDITGNAISEVGSNDSSDNNNEELEIDELCSLFTYYTKTNINEKSILDLIKHYYPDTYIEDDKYLLHTRCKLWNKKQDILKSLQKYKANSKNANTNASANASASANMEIYTEEIPINELYQFYCIGKNKFTVSKRYFERFIKEESQLYIIEDNFIKVESFSNI